MKFNYKKTLKVACVSLHYTYNNWFNHRTVLASTIWYQLFYDENYIYFSPKIKCKDYRLIIDIIK